jgi:hypothetical protein
VALVFLVAAGVTTAVTLVRVPLERWWAALGQPPGLLPVDAGFRSLLLWSTAALTVATVAYMLAVRHHFDA